MSAMFLSAILFGFMGLMVKILSQSIPAELIAFGRFFFGLFAVSILVVARLVKLKFVNRPLLIFRGIVGGFAILCYFKSVSLIPLADAAVISFSYPIFGTIFAAIFLKEELKPQALLVLMIALFGMVLVADPKFRTINIGYVFALISSLCAGAAVTSVRQLRKTDDPWSISIAQMVGGIIIVSLLSFKSLSIPNPNILLLLVFASLISTIGQLLLTYAYEFCSVTVGGTISLAVVPTTVVLAIVFLGETITASFLVGSSMIFGSAIYLLNSQTEAGSKG